MKIIDDDCVVTMERADRELRAIEVRLAAELGLQGPLLREQLRELDRAGKLVETGLVADWHDAYSNYISCLRECAPAIREFEEK